MKSMPIAFVCLRIIKVSDLWAALAAIKLYATMILQAVRRLDSITSGNKFVALEL